MKVHPGTTYARERNVFPNAESHSLFDRIPHLAKRFAVLLKIRCAEIVDFMFFQKSFNLHARCKIKQPAKLSSGKYTGLVGFKDMALQRDPR